MLYRELIAVRSDYGGDASYISACQLVFLHQFLKTLRPLNL